MKMLDVEMPDAGEDTRAYGAVFVLLTGYALAAAAISTQAMLMPVLQYPALSLVLSVSVGVASAYLAYRMSPGFADALRKAQGVIR